MTSDGLQYLNMLAITEAMTFNEYVDKHALRTTARGDNPLRPQDIDVSAKPPIIPNGCKEYYFDECGEFCTGDNITYIWKNISVYYCIASSDRVAKEKFKKKWLSKTKNLNK